MTWTQPEPPCRLCGSIDRRGLTFRLVHWKLSEPGMAYEHVVRCIDDQACRARVETAKKPWPLVEGRAA